MIRWPWAIVLCRFNPPEWEIVLPEGWVVGVGCDLPVDFGFATL